MFSSPLCLRNARGTAISCACSKEVQSYSEGGKSQRWCLVRILAWAPAGSWAAPINCVRHPMECPFVQNPVIICGTLNPFTVLSNFPRFAPVIALSCHLPVSEKSLTLENPIWLVHNPEWPHWIWIVPISSPPVCLDKFHSSPIDHN